MDIFYGVFTNVVFVNTLVGLFCSASIAIFIFFLTTLNAQRNDIRNMEIELTKYVFVSQAIKNTLINLSSIDGFEYRRFFGDMLDDKVEKLEDYKNIYDFIIFDKVAHLPKLSDYLVKKFIENNESQVNKDKIEELLDLLKKSEQEKKDYIRNKNLFIVVYEEINVSITRLNERLDYYRNLCKELIAIEALNEENMAQAKREFSVFKYCTNSIIQESKVTLELLNETNDDILSKKLEIKNDIEKLDRRYRCFLRTLISLLVLISLALLIA